jgi:hypothetical protein
MLLCNIRNNYKKVLDYVLYLILWDIKMGIYCYEIWEFNHTIVYNNSRFMFPIYISHLNWFIVRMNLYAIYGPSPFSHYSYSCCMGTLLIYIYSQDTKSLHGVVKWGST